jgi:hypothetical protein
LGPDAPSRTAEGWQIDDQLGFSNMIDEEALPWTSADLPANHSSSSNTSNTSNTTSSAWSGVLWGWNKRVKVAPLPPLVAANGHVAFEQRLPELLGVLPVAVHDTFQVYGAESGKLSRMQENNLWLLHPPEHFTANFLTYENVVTEYVARVARVWQQHTGRPMVLLHQHLLAAAFQLQVGHITTLKFSCSPISVARLLCTFVMHVCLLWLGPSTQPQSTQLHRMLCNATFCANGSRACHL